jgi:hypothetical protein
MKLLFSDYPKYTTYVVLGEFRANYREPLAHGIAVKSHFEDKDLWKGFGYFWDAAEKVWVKPFTTMSDFSSIVEELLQNCQKLINNGQLNVVTKNPNVQKLFMGIYKKLELAKKVNSHEIEKLWEVPSHDEKNYDRRQEVILGSGDAAESKPQTHGLVRLKTGKTQRVVLALDKNELCEDGLGITEIRQFGQYFAYPWQDPLKKSDLPYWEDADFSVLDEEIEELPSPPKKEQAISLQVGLLTDKEGKKALKFVIPTKYNSLSFRLALAWVKNWEGRKWNAEEKYWQISFPCENVLKELHDMTSQPWKEDDWTAQILLSEGVQAEIETLFAAETFLAET